MTIQTTDAMTSRVQAIAAGMAVPGLLFQLTPQRLRDHCKARAAYHERRAGEKQAQVPKLEEAVAALQTAIDGVKGIGQQQEAVAAALAASNFKGSTRTGYGFDGMQQVAGLQQQIDALQNDVKEHRNKSAMFSFLAESVFDAIYALAWDDLARLELVK